ncbi:ATP10 protein-domain-containing protein [Staphylotrichum tortipilum]|uniref:ATP10 protein-domain-containing protein n=1 Tax=Staphylotrichum tortipilum TaxID=2831512 RepID=A0AAN6MPI0_9PEZI|nr:ATP10 protein-domain-containing protein [Staphylotrichum longicolle]
MITRTGIRTGSRTAACLLCQWRLFSVSYGRLLADKGPSPTPTPTTSTTTTPGTDAKAAPGAPKPTAPPAPGAESPLAHAPRAYGKALKEFTPTPLSRPIGMNFPPNAGENTGVDKRSLKQRHADFTNYDKHLKRREYLKHKISRPYFRDWSNLQFHQGKTFLSPPRPFRADLSLFFPNLHGRTLAKTPDAAAADTTPVLEGRASVVSVFSSMWAETQARSFTDPDQNPALAAVLAAAGPARAQLVRVNVEEDMLKAWLVRLFSGSLRRKVGKENWDRYFLVRRGITDEIRESIGVLNSKVGYTYLVDHECRIRWAASGSADPGEKEGLVKGVERILSEMDKDNVGPHYVRKTVALARKQPEES